jgi:hypothetical protein
MRHILFHIRAGAYNLPHQVYGKRTAIGFKGIPISTINGALHVLFGQRPPGYQKRNIDYNLKIISRLAEGALYTFGSKVTPKIEDYFARESAYKSIKSAAVSERLMGLGVGPGFIEAIKEEFHAASGIAAFCAFQKACVTAFSSENSLEKDGAMASILRLREKADIAGENWRLSDGYLSMGMSKHWVARESPFGGKPRQQGSIGAPRKKVVFDADVYVPIPDDYTESEMQELVNMLTSAPATASFGEGGIAWIEKLPVSAGQVQFSERPAPVGWLKPIMPEEDLFFVREKTNT